AAEEVGESALAAATAGADQELLPEGVDVLGAHWNRISEGGECEGKELRGTGHARTPGGTSGRVQTVRSMAGRGVRKPTIEPWRNQSKIGLPGRSVNG